MIFEDQIQAACKRFCNGFLASAQAKGTVNHSETRVPISIPSELTLSDGHRYFYEHVVMTDSPTLGGDMFLEFFEPGTLLKRQQGWRWDGRTGKEIANWHPNWTVFADRNGDAIFAEPLAAGESRIHGAIQSRRVVVANSLAAFLEAIVRCVEIEEIDFSNETRNDDMSHKPKFLDRVREVLRQEHTEVSTQGFFEFFFE